MKKSIIYTMLVLMASSLIFTSCSITREKYTISGFTAEKLETAQELCVSRQIKPLQSWKATQQNEVLACENWTPSKLSTVPVERTILTNHTKKRYSKALLTSPPGDCDEIVLYGGDRMKAKVLEINENEIKYKKCDNLDGPTYTMSKSNVREIHYANGTDEMVSETGTAESKTIAPSMKVGYLGLALLMFLGALLSYIVAAAVETTAAAATGTVAVSGLFTASILASVFLLIGYLFAIAFLVFFVCWLLQLVS